MPFEVVPFKASGATAKPKPLQHRIFAVPEKAQYTITIPRVQGYSISVRNRLAYNVVDIVASLGKSLGK